MKKIFCIKILIWLIFTSEIFSIDTPFFYKGARPTAMGDAFTAISDDENSISYNPAGIIDINENKIAIAGKLFTYDFSNENYTNNYASFTLIYAKSFGIHIFYTLSGDKILLQPDKIFLYEGLKITAAFAHNISDLFYTGLSGNVIIQTGKPGGAEFDIGFIYKINKYIKTGLAIKNFISSGNFLILDDAGDVSMISYPVFLNLGISAKPFNFFLISFEIKNIFESEGFITDIRVNEKSKICLKRSYHLGGELNFLEDFFIMAGIKAGEDIFYLQLSDIYKMRYGISLGFGYRFKFIRINTGFVNDFREISNIKNPWQIYFSLTGDY